MPIHLPNRSDANQSGHGTKGSKMDPGVGQAKHEEPEVDDDLPFVFEGCQSQEVSRVLLEEVLLLPARVGGKQLDR